MPSLLSPIREVMLNLYRQHIYIIKNNINGIKYYGRTNNPIKRKNWHFSHLRKNIHGNYKLQNSFNKYGEENFSFKVIKEITGENKNELLELIMDIEQSYINLPEEKFNLSLSSRTPSNYIFHGENNPFYGKKHTPESKALQRKAKLGMYDKEKNPFYGKTHTPENRKKFSETAKKTFSGVPKTESHKRKISEALKNTSRCMPVIIDGVRYDSLNAASRATGISRPTISNRIKSEDFPNYKFTSGKRKV